MPVWIIALFLHLLILCMAEGGSPPKLYFYAQGNLRDPHFLSKLIGWMDMAKSCGYDGMFYADSDIQKLHIPGSANHTFHRALAAMQKHAIEIGLGLLPLIFPFGPSDPIFSQPKWGHRLAEPLAFRGALFEVDAESKKLAHVDEFAGIKNGEFSDYVGHSFTGWKQSAPGSRTFVATTGCNSPGSCLRVGEGSGDGLAMQELKDIAPYTQLNISFYAKTQGFHAVQFNVEIRSLLQARSGQSEIRGRMGRRLSWWSLQLAPTQSWTRFEYIASSWDGETPIAIFLGVEDRGNISGRLGQVGDLYFDDISVTTTALVNVLRREGAPLRVYDAQTGRDVVEGVDIDHIEDPLLYQGGRFDTYHEAPVVRFSDKSSRLCSHQLVRMDYYAVNPVFGSGVASCLMHEGIFEYMQQNAAAVAANYGWQGFLLSYDEIRQLHNDEQEAHFASAGDLMAWHVLNATRTARLASPKAKLYIWDDMFNPYHNAGSRGTADDGYFLINGSMYGSWNGLDPNEVSMMTWGPCDESAPPIPGVPDCKFRSGLKFFADRGLRQIIGGFYDYASCPGCPKNGTAAAEREFRFAQGIANIDGYSYTTWGSNNENQLPNYDQMCDYAATLRRLHASSGSLII
eukprot:TRINITY_DN56812_c0_g1_i1.p1 TRINITY_DN56812_c0_g1~~TRINITY_DN56812_c0_g1_i1.p1  ORF type:complete len:627 (-),score=73.53 TRINITY_DN56812_c0_g1_i1:149-2029(-)